MKRIPGRDLDWSKADGLWTQLNNREIAQRLGTTYSNVSVRRQKLTRQAKANGNPTVLLGSPTTKKTGNFDWSKADGLWKQLNNRQLAQRLKTTLSNVTGERQRLIRKAKANRTPTTPFESPSRKRKEIDWSKADGLWAQLNNFEIAQLLGVTYSTVAKMRQQLIRKAKANRTPTSPFESPPRKRKEIDWSKADGLWAQLNNLEIARRVGTGSSRVAYMRQQLIRKAEANRNPTTPFESPARKRKEIDWSKADGLWAQLNNSEIAQRVGTGSSRVAYMRQQLIRQAEANRTPTTPFESPPRKRKEIDWSKADGLWAQLNNSEIARRLGTGSSRVAYMRQQLIRQAKANRTPTSPFESPPRKRKEIDWSRANGLWSKMNNRKLANLLGLSYNTVVIARRRLIHQAAKEGKKPKRYIYQRT